MAIVHPKVDMVTMGGGWTAAIFAQKLTEAGVEIVSLEQGPAQWTNPDFSHNHDSLRYENLYAMMHNIGRESWTWRPNATAPALPMRQYGAFHPGQGVGGAAVHWTAQLWRFFQSDFRYRTHHVERYGEAALPAGNTVQDWPVTYDELEPYYDAFEYDIGAGGVAGNLRGEIQPGGNPFEGPRSRPYPNPPLESSIPGEMFADSARSLGYHPFPHPTGILSRAWTDPFGNTRSGCIYCGFCTRYGCEVDAKSSPITTHLPPALATGRYEIRTGCRVTGVMLADNGLATGLRYVDAKGREHEQPADIVVLSGYTNSNVRMLLLSRGPKHREGLGNNHGMVGRNMSYHTFQAAATGVFEGRRFNLFMGNGTTAYAMHDLNGDNFDHSDLDFIGGSSVFSGLGEREPIGGVAGVPTDTDKTWGREWKRRAVRDWDSYVPISVQQESLAYDDRFFDLDPNYTDDLGLPLLRITFDYKPNEQRIWAYVAERCEEIMRGMGPDRLYVEPEIPEFNIADYNSTHINGGAITGMAPDDSVANKYGQVWDCPNVFVTGAALFPQNAGHNPTDTVAAMAYLAAETIRDRYLRAPEELLA